MENFDEQIVFNQLDVNESAIWSLLMASGYLKAVEVECRGEPGWKKRCRWHYSR